MRYDSNHTIKIKLRINLSFIQTKQYYGNRFKQNSGKHSSR